jgi:membrane associated rhomboid family serine protease
MLVFSHLLYDLNLSLDLMINQTKANLPILISIIIILWSVFFVNLLLHKRLLYLGIIPRKILHLPGIFFSPFLHANFDHLFFNTIPLIVLSNMILVQGLFYFGVVTIMITITSGFLIWVFAKPGLYVGASAVITGYWGLLVSNIYQQGTLTAIIIGIISLYYLSGIFYGIFPEREDVSWQGHLFGLLAGLFTSYLLWH